MQKHSIGSSVSVAQLSALVKGPLHSISASRSRGSMEYLKSALQLYFFSLSFINVLKPAQCVSVSTANSTFLLKVYGTLRVSISQNCILKGGKNKNLLNQVPVVIVSSDTRFESRCQSYKGWSITSILGPSRAGERLCI